MAALKQFPPARNYSSLSVRDLLDARDAWHVHLAHLDGVVGTAVGRYLIHRDDWYATHPPDKPRLRARVRAARTLGNTVVRDWSWPCVLVFVDRWRRPEEFARSPDQMVPRALFLSDGRVVPTCVVLAEPSPVEQEPEPNFNFPSGIVGGGYVVGSDVQGEMHFGSVACLVTDGGSTYALTNRHVTGEPGRELFTFIRGRRERVGVSDRLQAGKEAFDKVYPGWPGRTALANLDAGLIRIDDVERWTSRIYGLPDLGRVVDMNTDTVSLDLIGCDLRAFGAASGPMLGRLMAFFYRYKSMGGYDYISDVLIAPRDRRGSMTRHGDSGTLWCLEQQAHPGVNDPARVGANKAAGNDRAETVLRPLALQWGGHRVAAGDGLEGECRFGLGTFLSTVCTRLDVDFVGDRATRLPEYWGALGHFSIGRKAADVVTGKLKTFLQANGAALGFTDEQTLAKAYAQKFDRYGFVPLPDVADIVWRFDRSTNRLNKFARRDDESNHFADMDEPGHGQFADKTLLDLWRKDKSSLRPAVWNAFYAELQKHASAEFKAGRLKKRVTVKHGALPFRVWQIFDLMKEYAKKGDGPRFLAAGGVLSHYAGDACQPLHISALHHGDDPDDKDKSKVHEAYETDMLNHFAAQLLPAVKQKLASLSVSSTIANGEEAAQAVVALMDKVVKVLPPRRVVDAFDPSLPAGERRARLWQATGKETAECIARGVVCLASIWQSAWKGGKITDLGEIEHDELMSLYQDERFVRSYTLQDLESEAVLAMP